MSPRASDLISGCDSGILVTLERPCVRERDSRCDPCFMPSNYDVKMIATEANCLVEWVLKSCMSVQSFRESLAQFACCWENHVARIFEPLKISCKPTMALSYARSMPHRSVAEIWTTYLLSQNGTRRPQTKLLCSFFHATLGSRLVKDHRNVPFSM